MNKNIICCIVAMIIIWFIFIRKPSRESFVESNKYCPLVDYQDDIDNFGSSTARFHLQERATRIKKAVANCGKSNVCPLNDMQEKIWNFHNLTGPNASVAGPIIGVETGLGYSSPEDI